MFESCIKGADLGPFVAFSEVSKKASGYGGSFDLIAPELPVSAVRSPALVATRQLLRVWGLDRNNYDTRIWNPLGDLIPRGSRILIKPNWVYHAPRGRASMDSLITHTSVIQAVLEYVALAEPASIIVGDAPLQGCDFDQLRRVAELAALESWALERNISLSIVDFRRTINPAGRPGGQREEAARSLDHFIRFDLGNKSSLRALDPDADRFRVTVYNPDLLTSVHRPGSHQYLIAREVLEADVIINMPKLKCHMKACITGALKNLIGINGHKEYLPHHRKGGSASGGDCYSGSTNWKSIAEDIADFVNRERGPRLLRYLLDRSLAVSRKALAFGGADDNIEGAWYGNDTIWRTCIDLNRILAYGSSDGRLSRDRRRTVINITDAIIAGEGEGPLKPTPVAAGFLTGALNPAAAEYAHARLMGLDPERIPLIRGAFESADWPLTDFMPNEIRMRSVKGEVPVTEIQPIRHFTPPHGWRGHCELQSEHATSQTHLASV